MANKNPMLEEFRDYLINNGHKEDYLEVISSVYNASKNIKEFNEIPTDSKDNVLLNHVVIFYEWYALTHPRFYYLFRFEDKVDFLYQQVKSVCKFKNVKTPSDKLSVLGQISIRTYLALDDLSNSFILELHEDGTTYPRQLNRIANMMFRALNDYPEIALAIKLKD